MDGHHGLFRCDGTRLHHHSGSWQGHFLPGFFFALWATHWLVSCFRGYLRSKPAHRWRSQAVWSFAGGANLPWAEPAAKVALPALGIAAELCLAHREGWRPLVCPVGSARSGRLAPHINNYMHAAMYFAFMVSGLVDLLACAVGGATQASSSRGVANGGRQRDTGTAAHAEVAAAAASTSGEAASSLSGTSLRRIALPPSLQHAFLALAFACEALLLALHQKHQPLDQLLHSLLAYTAAACAAAVALEAAFPSAFILASARILCTYLQAAWFFTIARTMNEGRAAWDASDGDGAPVMLVPVLFCTQLVLIAAGMLAAYFLFACFDRRWSDAASRSDDRSMSAVNNNQKRALRAVGKSGGGWWVGHVLRAMRRRMRPAAHPSSSAAAAVVTNSPSAGSLERLSWNSAADFTTSLAMAPAAAAGSSDIQAPAADDLMETGSACSLLEAHDSHGRQHLRAFASQWPTASSGMTAGDVEMRLKHRSFAAVM